MGLSQTSANLYRIVTTSFLVKPDFNPNNIAANEFLVFLVYFFFFSKAQNKIYITRIFKKKQPLIVTSFQKKNLGYGSKLLGKQSYLT
jgi:hypothetical protein